MQDNQTRSAAFTLIKSLRKLLVGLAAVTWITTAGSTFAGQDYDGATLAFPSDCAGRAVQHSNGFKCTLKFADGTLTINLYFKSYSIASFARYIGTTKEKFLENPDGYMRSALRKFEEIAVRERDTGQGDVKIIGQDTRAVSAKKSQTGLEQCLYFSEDVHVSEKSGQYLARVDISGQRCLGHDASIDRVWYAYVEVGFVHSGNVNQRARGFDKRSKGIIESLKLS